MEPGLAFRALTYGMIGLLIVILLAVSLISARKEIRCGQQLRGIAWFALAIMGLCALIARAGHVRKARSLEKVSDRVETVTVKPDALPR